MKRIYRSQENKYISIDREMSKAFREYDDLAIPPELLPTSNADVPAEHTLVPGMYTAFREEYLKEVTTRLEAANKRRERKMGGRK
jgi:hypothetical protein